MKTCPARRTGTWYASSGDVLRIRSQEDVVFFLLLLIFYNSFSDESNFKQQ